jgi:hypothetical protein
MIKSHKKKTATNSFIIIFNKKMLTIKLSQQSPLRTHKSNQQQHFQERVPSKSQTAASAIIYIEEIRSKMNK